MKPITIALGGPADPWVEEDRGIFPSTISHEAERHFEEFGKAKLFRTMGHHVINWIEAHCRLTDSHFAGQPFTLMNWQKRLLLEVYIIKELALPGLESDVTLEELRENEDYRRRHRWVLLGIPKKNGKTELAAALGNFHTIGDDEPSPNVICAAASEEQADLAFTAASRMAEYSPTLEGLTDRKDKIIEVHGKPGAALRKVATTAGTNDGKNVYVTIIDELHEWIKPKARSVFTVLTQGGGARRQPLNIMITTAGFDQDSICYELYMHGKAVREGVNNDEGFYLCWFEAPEDAETTDMEAHKIANPSWGLILQQEFYDDIRTKRTEAEYRRYFLNQWTEAEDLWEVAQHWDDLPGRPHLDDALPTFVAVDIGRRHDSSVVVVAQWNEERGGLQVKEKIWSNPYPHGHSERAKWKINVAEIENYMRELREEYPEPSMEDEDENMMDGPAFLFDPHFFSRSAADLEDEGLHMVEVPQTDTRMVPASQRVFDLVKSGDLVHAHDKTARSHIRAVVAKEKERGWRISKVSTNKHIDYAVALAMAAFYATESAAGGDDEDTVTIH